MIFSYYWILLLICATGPSQSSTQHPVQIETTSQSQWNILPSRDRDETGHMIFNSLNFLLQLWPNVRYRNGHTIVPGTIHPGTLLYHGSLSRIPPSSPDWVSFDPEQSYISWFGPILQTHVVLPGGLKVLYFDGSSGTKMPYGTMDTQELLIYGGITKNGWTKDNTTIQELCKWGADFGIDGFVRMHWDFEMMICDFTKNMALVSVIDGLPTTTKGSQPPGKKMAPPSFTYFPPPPRPDPTPIQWPDLNPPPGWRGSMRTAGSVLFESMEAGGWWSSAPGLLGIKLEYASAISFFNPRYRSLVEARRKASKREEYRAGWMTPYDVRLVKRDLEAVLLRHEGGRGVRWDDIMRSVEQRYAARLESLSALLNDGGKTGNLTSTIFYGRNAILVMLTPYLDATSVPSSDSSDTSWLAPAIRRCAMSTTARISPPLFTLTPQEELIRYSVETVLQEICQTLGRLWVEAFDAEAAPMELQSILVESWRSEVDRLMGWLGWAIWTRCDPPCGPMEMCSPPQWPFDLGMWQERRGMDNYTPTCISRLGGSVWQNIPDRNKAK